MNTKNKQISAETTLLLGGAGTIAISSLLYFALVAFGPKEFINSACTQDNREVWAQGKVPKDLAAERPDLIPILQTAFTETAQNMSAKQMRHPAGQKVLRDKAGKLINNEYDTYRALYTYDGNFHIGGPCK